MERSDILATMGELKLYGMKAAIDEIIATAVKCQHEPQPIVGDLLTAEVGEKQARSIKYHCDRQAAAGQGYRRLPLRRQSTKPWCATSLAATSWRISATWC